MFHAWCVPMPACSLNTWQDCGAQLEHIRYATTWSGASGDTWWEPSKTRFHGNITDSPRAPNNCFIFFPRDQDLLNGMLRWFRALKHVVLFEGENWTCSTQQSVQLQNPSRFSRVCIIDVDIACGSWSNMSSVVLTIWGHLGNHPLLSLFVYYIHYLDLS